jgi:hypothetical protein
MAKKGAAALLGKFTKTEEKKSKSETPFVELKPTTENVEAIINWVRHKRQERASETARKQQEELIRPESIAARKDHCMKVQKFTSTVKVKVDSREYKKAKLALAKTADEKKEIEALEDEYILTFVTQDKYSDIPLDREPALKATIAQIFGIKAKTPEELKLDPKTDKAIQDQLIQEELDSALENKFNELFVVEPTIKISDAGKLQLDDLLPKIIRACGGEKKPDEKEEEFQERCEAEFAKFFTVTQVYTPTEAMHQGRVLNPTIAAFADEAIKNGLIKHNSPSFKE